MSKILIIQLTLSIQKIENLVSNFINFLETQMGEEQGFNHNHLNTLNKELLHRKMVFIFLEKSLETLDVSHGDGSFF